MEEAIDGGLWDSGSGAAPMPALHLPASLSFSGKILRWVSLLLQLLLSGSYNSCSFLEIIER